MSLCCIIVTIGNYWFLNGTTSLEKALGFIV